MKKNRDLLRRQFNDVGKNYEILKKQMAEYEEKDGEKAIFDNFKVLPEVKGGPIKGVVHFRRTFIKDGPGYIKFSELPRLIKFLTTVAAKNGITV